MVKSAQNITPLCLIGRSLMDQNVAASAVIFTCWRNYADLKGLARLHSIPPKGTYLAVPIMPLWEQGKHTRAGHR